MNKIKKTQISDVNCENPHITRILIILLKSGLDRQWIISLMQNEGIIDNRKTMITFLFNDFRALRESQICEY